MSKSENKFKPYTINTQTCPFIENLKYTGVVSDD
jgi:hypothetical protein